MNFSDIFKSVVIGDSRSGKTRGRPAWLKAVNPQLVILDLHRWSKEIPERRKKEGES
jgi:hypothetical protein